MLVTYSSSVTMFAISELIMQNNYTRDTTAVVMAYCVVD